VWQDVVIASGGSGALSLTIDGLADEGDNILIPSPGFPLYASLCTHSKIEPRHYHLLSDRNWEADIPSMESLVDANTRAIIINNPSNPCGSVYSKHHLVELLSFAARHRLVVIADEVYQKLVFPGCEFIPCVSAGVSVPLLTIGAMSKEFLVPGWRVGWVIVHDLLGGGAMKAIRDGLARLSALSLGANTMVQYALPRILKETPPDFHRDLCAQLATRAQIANDQARSIDGLQPYTPSGALYMMVGIDPSRFRDIQNDVDFCSKLLAEENVAVFAGSLFGRRNVFRVVIAPPEHALMEGFGRIREFCHRHHV
jgi:tyrosine aminotransferase